MLGAAPASGLGNEEAMVGLHADISNEWLYAKGKASDTKRLGSRDGVLWEESKSV